MDCSTNLEWFWSCRFLRPTQACPEYAIYRLLEQLTRATDLTLQQVRHIVVEGEGRSHLMMLPPAHLDVKRQLYSDTLMAMLSTLDKPSSRLPPTWGANEMMNIISEEAKFDLSLVKAVLLPLYAESLTGSSLGNGSSAIWSQKANLRMSHLRSTMFDNKDINLAWRILRAGQHELREFCNDFVHKYPRSCLTRT